MGRTGVMGWRAGKGRGGGTYGRVAAPKVNPRVGDGVARVVVDDLNREAHVDARLAVRDVGADLLAAYIWNPYLLTLLELP